LKEVLYTTAAVYCAIASALAGEAVDRSLDSQEILEGFAKLEAEEFDLSERMGNVTVEQRRDAIRDLHEQRTKDRQMLSERARVLFSQPDRNEPIVLEISANASPEERKYLIEKVALENELDEVGSAYTDPEERRDAVQRWHEENKGRLFASEKLLRELQLPAVPPRPPASAPIIPADASPALRDYLTKQTELTAEEKAIHERFSADGTEILRDNLRELHERRRTRADEQGGPSPAPSVGLAK
jgi:hypothetical protein